MSADSLNYLLALGTIGLQVLTLGLLALYLLRAENALMDFLSQWGFWLALAASFIGSALSLYYSEILGLPPCPLCWWQRVFLYPQTILFALALWKRERLMADYSMALSVFGLGTALYHHALQVLPSGSLPCPAEGVISCAQRFVFEFGYITFPLMAATLFAFLIVLMLFSRRRGSH